MRQEPGFQDPFLEPLSSSRADRSPQTPEDADHRLYLEYEAVEEAVFSFPPISKEVRGAHDYRLLETKWLRYIAYWMLNPVFDRPGGKSGRFLDIATILWAFESAKKGIAEIKKENKARAKMGERTDIHPHYLDFGTFEGASKAQVEAFERHVREKLRI